MFHILATPLRTCLNGQTDRQRHEIQSSVGIGGRAAPSVYRLIIGRSLPPSDSERPGKRKNKTRWNTV